MTNIDYKLTTQWCDIDDCFVTSSEVYDTVKGVGETKEEAIQVFYELLEIHLQAEREGRLIKRPGRPAKENVRLSCNIPVATKAFIDEKAKERNVNQALIIQEAIEHYQRYLDGGCNADKLALDIAEVLQHYGINTLKSAKESSS